MVFAIHSRTVESATDQALCSTHAGIVFWWVGGWAVDSHFLNARRTLTVL